MIMSIVMCVCVCVCDVLANIFCKEPESKYFQFPAWGPFDLHQNYSTLPVEHERSPDNTCLNEHGCVPIKLYFKKNSWEAIFGHWPQFVDSWCVCLGACVKI